MFSPELGTIVQYKPTGEPGEIIEILTDHPDGDLRYKVRLANDGAYTRHAEARRDILATMPGPFTGERTGESWPDAGCLRFPSAAVRHAQAVADGCYTGTCHHKMCNDARGES